MIGFHLKAELHPYIAVRVSRPKGSFYVFADISSITHQSRQFALNLIKEEKVVWYPDIHSGYPVRGVSALPVL